MFKVVIIYFIFHFKINPVNFHVISNTFLMEYFVKITLSKTKLHMINMYLMC